MYFEAMNHVESLEVQVSRSITESTTTYPKYIKTVTESKCRIESNPNLVTKRVKPQLTNVMTKSKSVLGDPSGEIQS